LQNRTVFARNGDEKAGEGGVNLVFVLTWPVRVEVPVAVVVLGVITGLGNAALALGLVLVHRASRVVNLAHAEVGAAAAALMALLVHDHGWGWWPALALALAAGAGLSALIEAVVLRRLRDAPRPIVLLATAGAAQLLLGLSVGLIDHVKRRGGGYPAPFSVHWRLGPLVLGSGDVLLLFAVPLAAAALAVLLTRTSVGLGVRAAAENRDAAWVAGVPVRRVTTLAWAAAGALSALTAACLLPGQPLVASDSLGAGLLLRALAAAALARFTSMRRAVLAGIAVGVVDQVAYWNRPSGGFRDLVLFLVLLGALAALPAVRERWKEASSWVVATVPRPLPRRLATARMSALTWALATVVVAGAALAPLGLSRSHTLTLSTLAAYAVLALSTTIVVGAVGQLSLGQIAFFGVGVACSSRLTVSLHLPFVAAVIGAGAAGAAACVVVGLPAARRPGPLLPVATLGFAVMTQGWLLAQPWMLGSGVSAPRPRLGGLHFGGQRAYYLLALAVVVLGALAARGVLAGGWGRRLVATRDNAEAAAAFGLPPVQTMVVGFALAGALAGIGGAVYAHALQQIGVTDFPVLSPGLQAGAADSIRVLAMAVVGGLGSVPGAIAGAVLVGGVDRVVGGLALRLLTTSTGLLVLLLVFPGGIGDLWGRARLAVAKAVAR